MVLLAQLLASGAHGFQFTDKERTGLMSPSIYATICAIPVLHIVAYLYLRRSEQVIDRFTQLQYWIWKTHGAIGQPPIVSAYPDDPWENFVIRAIGFMSLLMCLIIDIGILIRICMYLRQVIAGQ
jgi:hypothetical protein